jgi:hypothetical protein
MYYFRLNRIYDDGSMDIHIEQLPANTEIEPEARNLGRIKDLPGGTGIWHGYVVEAATADEARQIVAESY